MNPKLLFILSLVIWVFNVDIVYSQEKPRRTLSIQEWIDEMVACEDSVYTLENADIFYDEEKDKNYLEDSIEIIINPKVDIINCNFNKDIDEYFRFLTFMNDVYIEECTGFNIHFIHCKFENGIEISNNKFHWVFFKNVIIKGWFTEGLNNIESIWFKNLIFEANSDRRSSYFYLWSNDIHQTGFSNSTFRLSDSLKNLPIDLTMMPVVFLSGSPDNLSFFNDTFDLPVSFKYLSVNQSLSVSNCKFNNFIDMGNINFPERNTNYDWKMLKNKLCIIKRLDLFADSLKIYLGKTNEELEDNYYLKELLAAYNKFFKLYRERGDIESANACYIEMKDIETRRWRYLYKQDPNLQTFSKWKLNQFLKIFCDYGTSPTKSLIISFYVVLIFAGFYFFFYSDWDRINRSFLVSKSRKLLKYFRSEHKLEDFYSQEHKKEFQTNEDFKDDIRQSKGEIPFFVNLFMDPLYRLSMIHYNATIWLYRRTEILSGKWTDLVPSGKLFVGSVVSCSILFYLIYLVALRSFNSLFLSINTFSTLGFGDIPVKGISRYMAILEGFLGWFLLSIFSVSLISQILQN